MSNFFIDWRKKENIKPLSLPNKEQYYLDLINIEHSWSGRMDTNIGNTFVMEAEQQIINAIELFEAGYFDCAYYSLRSAVEMSTTMVFLTDLPEEERNKYFTAWKATDDFPVQGKMIKQLIENGDIFSDMYKKMPDFFADAKDLSASLNKYVHKQGLQHFYISRNHPINQNGSQDVFIKNFQHYLEKCIGVVAVMRLAFDPFPILLMDNEILYRCFDSMTEPYSEQFVKKYIGELIIAEYKNTDLYVGTYDSFINEEKKNEYVFDVMKHQYIDSTKIAEIFEQIHLLSTEDTISVLLVASCEKIVKVYCYNGMMMFYTDKKTNIKAHSRSGVDFKRFSESDNLANQHYDEAYISVFRFEDEDYFVEHNELLDTDEIGEIVGFVAGALFKIKSENM